MKLIIAYLQPFLVEHLFRLCIRPPECLVRRSHMLVGFGRGRQAGEQEEEIYGTSARARVEVAANDDCVTPIVRNIASAAHTGKRGDGKIIVLRLETAIRIQTGEEGPSIL